jgi:hypothetical protein
MGQEIDERALTEDFVDLFDTNSRTNVWGRATRKLKDEGLYLSTSIRKSTREARTGADIGFTIERNLYKNGHHSQARYAALIQCKRIDANGVVADFYHTVASSGCKQSSLMLDITASSFYFVFTPPSLVEVLENVEPIAFAISGEGCSSPVWNMGFFECESNEDAPKLSRDQKAKAAGILVVPALAVEAQRTTGKGVQLSEVLANCLPFWYWFGELFIPGFVGDSSKRALTVASNVKDPGAVPGGGTEDFGVRHAITVGLNAG